MGNAVELEKRRSCTRAKGKGHQGTTGGIFKTHTILSIWFSFIMCSFWINKIFTLRGHEKIWMNILCPLGFLDGSVVKSPPASAGDKGSIPVSRRCSLEEEMATDSSTLAWRIPWTEESGGLQSMGSQRVGHDLQLNNNKLCPLYQTLYNLPEQQSFTLSESIENILTIHKNHFYLV